MPNKPPIKKRLAQRGNREVWQKIITQDDNELTVIYRQHWTIAGGRRVLSPDNVPFTTLEAAREWLNQD